VDSKEASEVRKYQPNELRQLIADWENGLITNEAIDIHMVDIMAFLVQMTGSQVRSLSDVALLFLI
jgi:hypothetical protein